MEALPVLISLAFRIFGAWYCADMASKLNRSASSWGFFGFFLPLLAIIWIHFMKPIMVWDKNLEVNENNAKQMDS